MIIDRPDRPAVNRGFKATNKKDFQSKDFDICFLILLKP